MKFAFFSFQRTNADGYFFSNKINSLDKFVNFRILIESNNATLLNEQFYLQRPLKVNVKYQHFDSVSFFLRDDFNPYVYPKL